MKNYTESSIKKWSFKVLPAITLFTVITNFSACKKELDVTNPNSPTFSGNVTT